MLNPDFRDMLSAFIGEGVEFLVVDAYALAAHGIPRATGYLDCWIRRDHDNAEQVLRALAAFGAPLTDGVSFDEAWPKRVTARIDGLDVPVIGREDLIRNKRALGRTKDLADIEALEAE